MSPRRRRTTAPVILVLLAAAAMAACSRDPVPASGGEPLAVGAIPDQDPEEVQRLHGRLAERLATALQVDVEYVPVTDYAAAVTLFRTGDLDLVWFGGLTGVQARAQTPGARAIAQRDIDAEFHSVFIANVEAGLGKVDDVQGLDVVSGRRMTFGSESSTSGRLMPQHFLLEAGVDADDFTGPPGFSGSHDATIDLVEAGTYEVGVLNEQVWRSRLQAGEVDTRRAEEIFRTPAYHDYHWLLHPDVSTRLGQRIQAVLLGLDGSVPEDAELLQLFGAERFIETSNRNYEAIEEVAEQLGLLAQ